jgi:hypothetical protein
VPIAHELGWTLHDHPWLFSDALGWMQPDFVLVAPSSGALVLECKLTWVDCAAQQTKYAQVLRAMGLKPTSLLVCRHLTPHAPASITNLWDAEEGSVLHWWL